ncbi:MAG: hypothetical protein IT422_03095 [Pirellulaceae bacterium]|nr:hypothetical protein [Pirellulaceae bacterium]
MRHSTAVADYRQQTVSIPTTITPQSDEQAKLIGHLMRRTAAYDEHVAGHYVNFPVAEARGIVSGHASRVMRQCEQLGFIDRNERYSVGRFAKSMRFTDEHRHGKYRFYKLANKMRRQDSLPAYCRNTLGPVGEWLFSRMQLFSLDHSSNVKTPWDHYTISSIRRGDVFAMRDEFGRRLHSTYSGLPRYLRPNLFLRPLYATYGREGQRGRPPSLPASLASSSFSSSPVGEVGKELVELDIRGCQPLLIGILARDHAKKTGSRVPGDIEEWIRICTTGDIYQYLADVLTSTTSGNWTRDQAKAGFMPAMFGSIEYSRTRPVYSVLETDFSSLLGFVESIKTQSDIGHRKIAQVSQRFESSLIIDGVCDELRQTMPYLPILTIHDALIVPRSNVPAVAQTVNRHFAKHDAEPRLRATLLRQY